MNYDKIVRYETYLKVKHGLATVTELYEKARRTSELQHQALKECQADRGQAWAEIEEMTQTENDLAELSQIQSEELTKCRQALVDAYNDRDEAHEVIRDLLGKEAMGMALAQAHIRADKLLARYSRRMDDGHDSA